jgi:hypothetical protein
MVFNLQIGGHSRVKPAESIASANESKVSNFFRNLTGDRRGRWLAARGESL